MMMTKTMSTVVVLLACLPPFTCGARVKENRQLNAFLEGCLKARQVSTEWTYLHKGLGVGWAYPIGQVELVFEGLLRQMSTACFRLNIAEELVRRLAEQRVRSDDELLVHRIRQLRLRMHTHGLEELLGSREGTRDYALLAGKLPNGFLRSLVCTSFRTVDQLVRAKFDYFPQSSVMSTPRHRALWQHESNVQREHEERAWRLFLQSHNSNISTSDQLSALWSMERMRSIAKQQRGADMIAADANGWRLQVAAVQYHLEAVASDSVTKGDEEGGAVPAFYRVGKLTKWLEQRIMWLLPRTRPSLSAPLPARHDAGGRIWLWKLWRTVLLLGEVLECVKEAPMYFFSEHVVPLTAYYFECRPLEPANHASEHKAREMRAWLKEMRSNSQLLLTVIQQLPHKNFGYET